jgi:hypothetical protein
MDSPCVASGVFTLNAGARFRLGFITDFFAPVTFVRGQKFTYARVLNTEATSGVPSGAEVSSKQTFDF